MGVGGQGPGIGQRTGKRATGQSGNQERNGTIPACPCAGSPAQRRAGRLEREGASRLARRGRCRLATARSHSPSKAWSGRSRTSERPARQRPCRVSPDGPLSRRVHITSASTRIGPIAVRISILRRVRGRRRTGSSTASPPPPTFAVRPRHSAPGPPVALLQDTGRLTANREWWRSWRVPPRWGWGGLTGCGLRCPPVRTMEPPRIASPRMGRPLVHSPSKVNMCEMS
jgi:hypothetical protein